MNLKSKNEGNSSLSRKEHDAEGGRAERKARLRVVLVLSYIFKH